MSDEKWSAPDLTQANKCRCSSPQALAIAPRDESDPLSSVLATAPMMPVEMAAAHL
jgi:hypothetical protein